MTTNMKTEIMQNHQIDNLYKDACIIIDKAQQTACSSVNETLIKRNWLLGLRIQHEIFKEPDAGYDFYRKKEKIDHAHRDGVEF